MSRAITTTRQEFFSYRWRIAAAIALIAGLIVLSGSHAFDCARAASYCLRSRKANISMLRIDQEFSYRDTSYVFASSSAQ